jgi:hypothetical protein
LHLALLEICKLVCGTLENLLYIINGVLIKPVKFCYAHRSYERLIAFTESNESIYSFLPRMYSRRVLKDSWQELYDNLYIFPGNPFTTFCNSRFKMAAPMKMMLMTRVIVDHKAYQVKMIYQTTT